MVSHVRINVSSRDGNVLLEETHSMKFGARCLLGVPDKLGYTPSSMLCFPFEEETGDLTNRGDPFLSICNIFLPGNGSTIATTLEDAGYEISEGSVAQIWVRVGGFKRSSCDNNVGDTGFNTDSPSSQLSRMQFLANVKVRMKQLCNEMCPRNSDGVMLGERAQKGDIKRPAWCTAHII
jgi:hypothetical protein